MKRGFRACVLAPRYLAVVPLLAYRRLLSPLLPARCRYSPSCSAYALEALQARGVIAGSALTVWRLLRCNPWSQGGHDPVPGRRSCLHEPDL